MKRFATMMSTVIVFVAVIAINLCIQPFWHSAPTMPECLRSKINE